jgi:hypothetical protein
MFHSALSLCEATVTLEVTTPTTTMNSNFATNISLITEVDTSIIVDLTTVGHAVHRHTRGSEDAKTNDRKKVVTLTTATSFCIIRVLHDGRFPECPTRRIIEFPTLTSRNATRRCGSRDPGACHLGGVLDGRSVYFTHAFVLASSLEDPLIV